MQVEAGTLVKTVMQRNPVGAPLENGVSDFLRCRSVKPYLDFRLHLFQQANAGKAISCLTVPYSR